MIVIGLKLKARIGSLLLTLLLQVCKTNDGITNAFTHSIEYSRSTNKRYGIISLESRLYDEIVKRDLNHIFPRHLPMLLKPKEWTDKKKGFGGCYFRLKTNIMRTFSQKHVEALSKSNIRPVLDGLNYLGKQPWCINKQILKIVSQAWEDKLSIAELPPQDDIPLPKAEDCFRLPSQIRLEEEKRKSNHKLGIEKVKDADVLIDIEEKTAVDAINQLAEDIPIFDERFYNSMVKRVKKKNAELHSLRCDFKIKLMIANKFQDDVIYFPWNLDFRGRAYPVPENFRYLMHMTNVS